MKSIANGIVVFIFLFVIFGVASATILEERNKIDTQTSKGKAYEIDAIKAFWGNAAFMRECAPPGTPVAEHLKILFVVKRDGTLGEIVIAPETKVGSCIRKHVAKRKFPIPKKEFVVRIYLQFTP